MLEHAEQPPTWPTWSTCMTMTIEDTTASRAAFQGDFASRKGSMILPRINVCKDEPRRSHYCFSGRTRAVSIDERKRMPLAITFSSDWWYCTDTGSGLAISRGPLGLDAFHIGDLRTVVLSCSWKSAEFPGFSESKHDGNHQTEKYRKVKSWTNK